MKCPDWVKHPIQWHCYLHWVLADAVEQPLVEHLVVHPEGAAAGAHSLVAYQPYLVHMDVR